MCIYTACLKKASVEEEKKSFSHTVSLTSTVYFVKFYMCISSCVRVLNVLLHNNWSCVFMEKYTFSVIEFNFRFAKWLQKQDPCFNTFILIKFYKLNVTLKHNRYLSDYFFKWDIFNNNY